MRPDFSIVTPQQILRRMTPDDAQGIFDLNADPEVLRYAYDDPFASVEAARAFLETYQEIYDREGCARFAAIDRVTGEYLGWCGLRYLSGGEVDVGYRYKKSAWGRGLATEAAGASLRFGFDDLGLKRIVARAHKDNGASIRVMQKIGMRFEADDTYEGHPAVRYVATS